LYQHLIQNKTPKLLADCQSRYVTFYPAFAVYGNGLILDVPFMEMARQASIPAIYGNGGQQLLSVAK
jgi:hypothetical protein